MSNVLVHRADGGGAAMELRMLLGPIYAAACAALCVGAVSFAKAEAREKWQGRPFVWGAVLAIVLAFIASRIGIAPSEIIAGRSFVRAIAALALVSGAVALMLALKARSRAAACFQAQPLTVDEAIVKVRSGDAAEGVFEGQVSCEDPVTSPGGIVCVGYEAELREARLDGARGQLLSAERAYAHVLQLRGDRLSAQVAFHPVMLTAKTEVRRCRLAPKAEPFSPTAVLADGALETAALSWERVLRMGERVRIVGKLETGANQGTYRIKGVAGQPPLVLVGEEVSAAGKRFFRSAMAHFGASVVLCALAAYLLHG